MGRAYNVANPGPKSKYYSLQMANRIPEVEQERKLTEIRRYHALFKRDTRIEEQKLWEILFQNDNALKTSIAIHSLEDILEGKVPLTRQWKSNEEEPPPFSEVYRQFIIYRATMMAKIFGKGTNRDRPNYRQLYKEQSIPMENNKKNYEQLVNKYGTPSPQRISPNKTKVDDTSKESKRTRKMSTTSSVVMARPHHRKNVGGDSQTGSDVDGSEVGGPMRRKSVDLSVPSSNEMCTLKLPPIHEKMS